MKINFSCLKQFPDLIPKRFMWPCGCFIKQMSSTCHFYDIIIILFEFSPSQFFMSWTASSNRPDLIIQNKYFRYLLFEAILQREDQIQTFKESAIHILTYLISNLNLFSQHHQTFDRIFLMSYNLPSDLQLETEKSTNRIYDGIFISKS